jgi:hypothetical protein
MPLFTRRQLLQKTALAMGGTAIGGGATLAWGHYLERHWITIERVSVTLPRLPAALDGLRLAHISDLHLEPWTKAEHIADTVKVCNDLKPDLVLITGDLITSSPGPAGQLGDLLSKLEATHGVYASLGNHDVWNNPFEITRQLEQQGTQVLRNQGARIETASGSFFLAGLDSFWSGRPDLRHALRDWQPGLPLILLVHEPDGAIPISREEIPALQLSGHTHGGQVCIPFFDPIALRLPSWGKKFKHGLHRVGEMQLYVNRGIGCVELPIRIACPPEVTEITLRSPEVLRA